MDELTRQVLLGTGVLLLLIAMLTFLTNGMLLYTMYCNPIRCFRSTSATFVACLSVTDFLTGALTAIDVGISSLLHSQGIQPFKVRGILHEKLLSQFTVRSGILVVVAFAFERLLAVACPFLYRNHASCKKALVCSIICCVAGLLASLLELALDKETFANMSYYGFFVCPLSVLVIAYLSIYVIMRVKIQNAKIYQNSSDSTQRIELERERKLVVTAFFIVLGFLFSYSFWFTVVLIGNHCPYCKTQPWYYACYRASIPFLYVNSSLNPLLYAWRMPKYRASFLLIFKNNNQVQQLRVTTDA